MKKTFIIPFLFCSVTLAQNFDPQTGDLIGDQFDPDTGKKIKEEKKKVTNGVKPMILNEEKSEPALILEDEHIPEKFKQPQKKQMLTQKHKTPKNKKKKNLKK